MTDFNKKAKYAIDTSSLLEFFNDERKYCKKYFVSLWQSIEAMIKSEEIVSHIQVYDEITEGNDELSGWAKNNKKMFKNYVLPDESDIIKQIGEQFPTFVHQKKEKQAHADPWLVAQAKLNDLVIITEENPHSDRKIPAVCRTFKIGSINLFELIKERKWKF